MSRRFALVLASALLGAQAHASPIGSATATVGGVSMTLIRDEASGLDWVPFTYTRGEPGCDSPVGCLTYDGFLSGERGFLAAGFRVATYAEVCGVLNHLDGIDCGAGAYQEFPVGPQPPGFTAFGWNLISYFHTGDLWQNGSGYYFADDLRQALAAWTWNRNVAEDPVEHLVAWSVSFQNPFVWPYPADAIGSPMLVRSVPEPGAAALLGAGLALLATGRRRCCSR